MKTISDLQVRWWYRLLKVAFSILLFVFLVTPVVIIVVTYNPEFDNKNSYAICEDGRQVGLDENGITLYGKIVWDDDDKEFKYQCMSNKALGYFAKIIYKNAYNDIDDEEVGKRIKEKYPTYISAKDVGLPSPVDKNYTVVYKYETRNWLATIGFSLLSIFITLGIFEMLRRIFYYIVLGKIRPEK